MFNFINKKKADYDHVSKLIEQQGIILKIVDEQRVIIKDLSETIKKMQNSTPKKD